MIQPGFDIADLLFVGSDPQMYLLTGPTTI